MVRTWNLGISNRNRCPVCNCLGTIPLPNSPASAYICTAPPICASHCHPATDHMALPPLFRPLDSLSAWLTCMQAPARAHVQRPCGQAGGGPGAFCYQDRKASNHRHPAPIWICTPSGAFSNAFEIEGMSS